MKLFTLAGLSVLVLTTSFVAEASCQLRPEQLERVASTIRWQDERGRESNTAVIRADLHSERRRGQLVHEVDYEAFIRPDHDDSFQILPIPLFMVEMEKTRDTVYICSHMDSGDASKNLTVIYFLRYNQIRAITPVPLPIRQLGKLIWGPIENTPFIVTRLPLTVLARIQSIVVHAFSDLTRIGIDRVRVTSAQIELYSGGDVTQFKSQNILKVLPLK